MARPVKPGAVVIPQTAEMRLVWGIGTHPWANVFHGKYSTPPTFSAALANSIFTMIKGALTSSGWGVQVAPEASMIRLEIKDINSANNVWWISDSAPAAGTGLSNALPSNLAIEVTARTAKSGRGFVGRHYMAGLDSGVQVDAYTFESTAGDAAVAFWEAVRTGLTSNGLTMALAQKELLAGQDANGNAMPPRAANSEPIIRHDLTDYRFDTQRRRLGR